MPFNWQEIPIGLRLFQNLDESVLSSSMVALENAFITEAKGQSRFPGLKPFVTVPDGGRVYLNEWRGDLVAATNRGRIYRIGMGGQIADVTGTPISGGRRIVFDQTEDELVMAAGAEIIRLAKTVTEILSESAPRATHIGYVDGYLVANEVGTGRFYHSVAGDWRNWNPIDVFTAESKPDQVSALVVTPYRELLLCGEDSIEQWERLTEGDQPFFRRWAVGEGLFAPYTLIAADNGTWAINKELEFVRFSGQISAPASDEIQIVLSGIDDWTDAWGVEMQVRGQKFLLLQAPFATNIYGTKGVTLVFDYRARRWASLYAWDSVNGAPARWPGWSHWFVNQRHFIGGEDGKIWELDQKTFDYDGMAARVFGRTAPYDRAGESDLIALRARIKRGVGDYNSEKPPVINLRVRRDSKTWSRWIERSLGRPGETDQYIEFGGFGGAHTFQIEWFVTDPVDFEIVKFEGQFQRIGS